MLRFVFIAVNKALTIDENKDGNISLSETFSIITTLSFKFPELIKAFPFLKKEGKELSPEEIEELKEFINSDLDLPLEFDNIEESIKRTVNMLHYNYRYVREMKVLFQKDDQNTTLATSV
jgi:ribosomal protein S13